MSKPFINKGAKMKKLFQNQKVISFFRLLKPYATILLVLLVLRYTGALSGISAFTNRALLKTGAMDATIEEVAEKGSFNYNFTVKDLKGNTIHFNQFKGKVVFINLWATWCGPCRAEMPDIQNLYDKIDKTKIEFVMLDWFENQEKASKFISSKNYTFPVYLTDDYLPKLLNVPSY